MSFNAIETEYKGYLFRSRLEARWAVFFDELGIEWKYETEGYQIGEYRYLPDFWLPQDEVFVEVKGDPEGLRNDSSRMLAMLGRESPLPGFTEGRTSLVILGDVPEVRDGTSVLHPCLSRSSGVLQRTWGLFVTRKSSGARFLMDRHQSVIYLPFGKYLLTDPADSPDAWSTDPWILDTVAVAPRVLDSYRAARQSRFEHGANGR